MDVRKALIRVSESLWELPVTHKAGMRVPGRIFASEGLLGEMDAGVFEQLANVATLPGVVDHVYCMPDGHWGYGFPIGGLAATDLEEGVISPGGIGFDINCGVRLIRTDLTEAEVRPRLRALVDRLFERIPAGVGGRGFVKMSRDEFRELTEQGSRWCLKHGYAQQEDLEHTEEGGWMGRADARKVSDKAVERGYGQVGTLGSGNHYLEIQVARRENVFDGKLARAFGIDRPNQVVIMLHCGSRGFGHQLATDYLRRFLGVMTSKYHLSTPDRELACAPFASPDGQDYFAAMNCAINMAFANRQVIFHRVREVFSEFFHKDPDALGIRQVYDVCHNTAKIEKHTVGGQEREVLVHRKGATRAFAAGMGDLPAAYRETGQPVIIGGSMETGSYLLAGSASGKQAFYTTAHGSGRTMSRRQAKRTFRGSNLLKEMASRGIQVRAVSLAGLAEEAGGAYKDIDAVVAATQKAGLSVPVVRLLPIGNIKG